jgi:hypothetical protein
MTYVTGVVRIQDKECSRARRAQRVSRAERASQVTIPGHLESRHSLHAGRGRGTCGTVPTRWYPGSQLGRGKPHETKSTAQTQKAPSKMERSQRFRRP